MFQHVSTFYIILYHFYLYLFWIPSISFLLASRLSRACVGERNAWAQRRRIFDMATRVTRTNLCAHHLQRQWQCSITHCDWSHPWFGPVFFLAACIRVVESFSLSRPGSVTQGKLSLPYAPARSLLGSWPGNADLCQAHRFWRTQWRWFCGVYSPSSVYNTREMFGQSWTILDISFDSFRMSSLKAFRLHRPEFVLESCWDAVELPAPFQLLSSQRSGSEADWQEEFQSLCQELGLEHHIAIHSIIRSSHDIFVLRYLR